MTGTNSNSNEKPPMKVLVCGGRDFTDYERVAEVLDDLHRRCIISAIIEGGQRKFVDKRPVGGADYLGYRWAGINHVEKITVPAEWHNLDARPCLIKLDANGTPYNVLAGFNRNQKMLEHEPDLVVAFYGGNGTADMVKRAREAGIKVLEVDDDFELEPEEDIA